MSDSRIMYSLESIAKSLEILTIIEEYKVKKHVPPADWSSLLELERKIRNIRNDE